MFDRCTCYVGCCGSGFICLHQATGPLNISAVYITALTPKPTEQIIYVTYDGDTYAKIGAGAASTDWLLIVEHAGAYVQLAGANALAADQTMTWGVPAGAGMVTRLDGGDNTKAQIENFHLKDCTADAGSF